MKKAIIFIIGVVFVVGCAGGQLREGQRRDVEKSGSRPDWVSHLPEAKDGKMFFRGSRTRALAFEDGTTDARMDAMRQVAEKVRTEVDTSYEKARVEAGIAEDDRDAGRDLEDGIIAKAKAAVTGAQEEDSYWVKYEEMGKTKISYYYDFFMLVSLTEENFKKSLLNTFEKEAQKARAKKNKKAEDVLKRMRDDIKERSLGE